jgi:uncharacterized protein (UPF0261 family)
MYVLILATCDTKGLEAAWLRTQLDRLGVPARVVDTGCLGEPACAVDVSREEVFEAAGTTHPEVLAGGDRGRAVNAAAEGARRLVLASLERGELAGVIGLGGSAGTTIGTAAMRALPLGLPKLMVSTLASGQVRPFVGDRDVMMLNSVVDIAGINRISRKVLGLAVSAMAGMVQNRLSVAMADPGTGDRPLVAATMFGVTTPCVERAKAVLEEAGYEVLVFHATGNGGESFESLVRSGMLVGVLDLTTTELCDELVGGILSAGPTRLTAAAEVGLPQVVSVGATDMVNFGPRASLPPAFEGRLVHEHNANVTLMRTTAEECAAIGREIGEKVGASRGPASILLPARGVSALDAEGRAFDDPAARAALLEAVAASCGGVPCRTLDHHINDPEFAEAAARELISLLQQP